MRIACLTPLARRGPWRAPEYGCASWCLALGGEFFPYAADDLAPLADFDLLLLHTSMAYYRRAMEIMERFPDKPAVLLLTCDAMFIDPQGFFPGFERPLRDVLDRAALAVTETEEVAFFQAMTATPVIHLPLPMPLTAMRNPPSPPRSVIWNVESGILLGAALRPKKNGLATALAFKRLREQMGGGFALSRESANEHATAVVFAEEPEAERAAYHLWGIEGVEVRPSCPQPDYWRQAAACRLALHLDYRRTIGRFSAECAALGVPCVSTAGATMQRACWPELIVEPWDVEGAAALGRHLLKEPAVRERVVARAARAIAPFDLAPMAARFRGALSRLGL